MKHSPAPARPPYQAIRADELLPLPVLKERYRWGDETISKAQKEGLPVLRYGKWKYVRGSDLIAFISQGAGDNQDHASGSCGGCGKCRQAGEQEGGDHD